MLFLHLKKNEIKLTCVLDNMWGKKAVTVLEAQMRNGRGGTKTKPILIFFIHDN